MTNSGRTVRRDRPLKDRVPWVNEQGGTIPAYGCVKLTARTSSGRKVYEADKPDGDGSLHFANGPVAVPATQRSSSGLWLYPRQVLMDAGVQLGDEIGPQADSWAMGAEGTGFVCFRAPVAGVGVAMQVGGGSTFVRVAEVLECLGGGYYRMQIETGHQFDVPESTVDGNGVDACDLCTLLSDAEDAECGETDGVPDREVATGNSTVVLAYDPRATPLEIPGMALITPARHTVPDEPYGTGGTGYEDDSALWFVLNGTYPIIGIPHEEWACCTDPDTGAQFIKLIKCDVYMVEGVLCPGVEDPCPDSY